jgi:hypothetical protein
VIPAVIVLEGLIVHYCLLISRLSRNDLRVFVVLDTIFVCQERAGDVLSVPSSTAMDRIAAMQPGAGRRFAILEAT